MFIRSVQVFRAFLLLGALLTVRSGELQAEGRDDFFSQAVVLAQESQRETGVPASVTLAQAILESGWGDKPIAAANNYFGIKASLRPDGSVDFGRIAIGWIWAWTKEWDGSRYVDLRSRFRTYRDMADSFRDHGILFVEKQRYAEAMRHVDDPDEFARQIAKAGYATAPDYADNLIELMSQEDLYRYDLKRDDAQVVNQLDSLTVEPGQGFQVYFEVKNVGLGTWSEDDAYYLANTNEGVFDEDPLLAVGSEITPGGIKRWTINMKAPATPGTYRTHWMLRHGRTTFGPEMHVNVIVSTAPEERRRLQALLFIGSLLLAFLALRIMALRGHFEGVTMK